MNGTIRTVFVILAIHMGIDDSQIFLPLGVKAPSIYSPPR